MDRRTRLAAAGLAVLAVAACDMFAPTECTLEARPGLLVELTDSLTGARVRLQGQIRAIDGAFADSTAHFRRTAEGVDTIYANIATDFTGAALVYERPGRYRVEVEQVGYRDWARDGVRITEGECHVRLTRLTVRLQRP